MVKMVKKMCSHCYGNLVLDKGFYIISRRSWRVFHQYNVVLWGHLSCRADGIFRCSGGQHAYDRLDPWTLGPLGVHGMR